MTHPKHRAQTRGSGLRARQLATLLTALLTTLGAHAAPPAARSPEPADPALPALATSGTLPPNPYRGQDGVLAIGALAYARHCAACHGDKAENAIAEGPDLRRLNSACQRLRDASLRPRCLKDVDAYFLESVLHGKLRAGLMHMPAWQGVLAPETIWAIRSYTETRPLPPPRTLPDLPPAGR